MTYFLQNYTLHYTPLSPIHIGTGDSYEPTNYVIDDQCLYEFDSGGALAALDATARQELEKIVSGKSDDILKAVQAFFYRQREALKPWAKNTLPVLDGVTKLYAARVGQTANKQGNGVQIINKLEIGRTAYNPVTSRPVLFGSAIKGALRTALLNAANQNQPLSDNATNWFKIDKLEKFERKKYEKEQNKLFPQLNQKLFSKFEQDPLRLVQISDAAWCSQDNLPSAQVQFSVNRKKELKRDKNGTELYSNAEKQNLSKLLECLPAWRYRAFCGQLNLQQINITGHNQKQPSADLRYTISQIAKTCSSFYLPILKNEIKILRERGFLDDAWDNSIQALLSTMAIKMQKGEVFLLRVGRHSGAESITLNGVRHIKIMKGTPEYQPQTKTLWLAADQPQQRNGLLPFGWVLVEISPGDASAPDWTELAELCEQHTADARLWAEKLAAHISDLAEKRVTAADKRQREESERLERIAEEKADAEKKRIEAQAEQRRLAIMSDEQRQIEVLRQLLSQKQNSKVREQIGGPLYTALRALVTKASDWPDEAKAELLVVAKLLLDYIGAAKNAKAKELLKNL
ncbi:hypothetical protein KEF85_03470 [Methylomonas paludis]|uniref:CRISPR system Cms protein Csm5 n=1 Tax=Methylomonas paludis TaxID=1173101 RepID=A0A975RAP3_9GAMM|nr:RAMP superfamily CRISPR-associated protein [Methylomonas paludis]QWF71553.1 hypothetical protein KEF85_03470 [Methylomonas paludis]